MSNRERFQEKDARGRIRTGERTNRRDILLFLSALIAAEILSPAHLARLCSEDIILHEVMLPSHEPGGGLRPLEGI